MMRDVIFPLGSITIIDIDCGSTKSVESARYGMMLAMRPEYAVAVAGVVSATMLSCASIESSNTTLRPATSFTRTRPPGNARSPRMLFHVTALLALIAPSWRIGGCCDCCAPAVAAQAMRSIESFFIFSGDVESIKSVDREGRRGIAGCHPGERSACPEERKRRRDEGSALLVVDPSLRSG